MSAQATSFFKKALYVMTITLAAYFMAFFPLALLNLTGCLFAEKVLASNALLYDVLDLLATGMAIILIYVSYRRKEPEIIPFEKEGSLTKYGLGLLAGGLVFTVIWLLAILLGLYRADWIFKAPNLVPLLILFIAYLIQGMSEEVIFRGFMQTKLTKCLSPVWAIVLTALAFAAMHLANPGINFLAFTDLIIYSLIVGLIRQKTNSLWFIGAYHSAWNFVMGPVYGINTSGLASASMVFKSVNLTSVEWNSGGKFGLEASIITVLIDLGLLVCVYLIGKRGKSRTRP